MKKEIPTIGYILPKWGTKGKYRATALAYMQRENEHMVEHVNGNFYSIDDLRSAVIGSSK